MPIPSMDTRRSSVPFRLDGKAYSHLESNRYDSLIEDYRAFAYNNLFGAQQRCGSFFQPPQ